MAASCASRRFSKGACRGRIRTTSKVEEEGKTGYRNQARGEEKSGRGWLASMTGLISNR
jgi:hypothetical protein